MNIKMIALDLDGTTLCAGGILAEQTKKVLQMVIQKGIRVVIASGRAYTTLPEAVTQMEGIDYAIVSNGAGVYDITRQKRIYSRKLNQMRVKEIIQILEEQQIKVDVFVDGVAYSDAEYYANPILYGAPEQVLDYVRRTRHPLPNIYQFAREHSFELDSMAIISNDVEKRTWIRRQLNHMQQLYITSSVPHMIEIADEEAGKAKALQYLAKKLQIEPEQILAFGNEENDIDMLRYAGIGIAVANATDQVKAYADAVTASNEEEGVAKALEQYLNL